MSGGGDGPAASAREPAAIEPDGKDWTWVLARACPECGYDAAAITGRDVAGLLRDEVAGWRTALAGSPAAVLTRPSPQTWSVLEYGAHVRDVCRVAVGRFRLMLSEDDARFADWDQDAAATADAYGSQDPARVSDELAAAAGSLADLLDGVRPADWSRTGLRSNGSAFTVDTLARYVLHDVVHHGHDIAG